MRENSFAVMTSVKEGDLLATSLPFVFKENEGDSGALYGHFSAQNPQVSCLNGDAQSMVVFNGPHAYISASWYDVPEKRVPTWNYISVQAKGRAVTLPKTQWLTELSLLASQYEEDDAWHLSMAEDYATRLLSGIVYFRLEIEEVIGFRKMSRNKNRSENLNIIRELKVRGEHAVAVEMEAVLSKKE